MQIANSQSAHFAVHKFTSNAYVLANGRKKAVTGLRSRRSCKKRESETKMNLKRSFSAWRKYRQTVNELSRMSDRELSDLGIARGDIAYVARRSVN
jgi:uncharacterized protein YjiS (DUF1127 family)